MKLVPNWREVLKHSWSVRLMVAAFLFSAAEYALPFYTDVIPDHVMGFLGGVATGGGVLARVLFQASLSGESK
ncbi:hypothetical protein [Aureimonas sp. SK2]|uniref:DUF7940 domain-containing protein n=1 Tax=Aureimonas sp. SK2 TaxID=3015992 RepID=UPI002443983E|nr:hypothetical protein [Aureimonas sp. SK2]